MIELVARKNRDEKRQIAFIKVDGQEFSVGNVPIELDTDQKVLDHLAARESEVRFVMLLKQYPEADWKRFRTQQNDDLAALQAWIAAGCKNAVLQGQDEEGKAVFKEVAVERVPLGYKIPKDAALIGQAIDGAKTLAELKTVLKNLIMP